MDAHARIVEAAIVWAGCYQAMIAYNKLPDSVYDPVVAKAYVTTVADAQDLLLKTVSLIRC
jgi:hypothetical protein